MDKKTSALLFLDPPPLNGDGPHRHARKSSGDSGVDTKAIVDAIEKLGDRLVQAMVEIYGKSLAKQTKKKKTIKIKHDDGTTSTLTEE